MIVYFWSPLTLSHYDKDDSFYAAFLSPREDATSLRKIDSHREQHSVVFGKGGERFSSNFGPSAECNTDRKTWKLSTYSVSDISWKREYMWKSFLTSPSECISASSDKEGSFFLQLEASQDIIVASKDGGRMKADSFDKGHLLHLHNHMLMQMI